MRLLDWKGAYGKLKLINILIAIISGMVVLTYWITGLDFMGKEGLIQVINSMSFIILLLSLSGIYILFRHK